MALSANDAFAAGGGRRNRRRRARRGALSEINVTPLVDVMLVLLIIFMVTMPIQSVPVDVDLPQKTLNPPPQPKEPLA